MTDRSAPDGPAPDDPRFATAWVHAFEEDTAAGAVYRPADADLPLSRRPRERLELAPDGSARAYGPGPDDRPRPRSSTWQPAWPGTPSQRAPAADFAVVEWTADRLVVRQAPEPRG